VFAHGPHLIGRMGQHDKKFPRTSERRGWITYWYCQEAHSFVEESEGCEEEGREKCHSRSYSPVPSKFATAARLRMAGNGARYHRPQIMTMHMSLYQKLVLARPARPTTPWRIRLKARIDHADQTTRIYTQECVKIRQNGRAYRTSDLRCPRHTLTSAAKLERRASRKGCSTWQDLSHGPYRIRSSKLDFKAILNFSH